MNLRKDHYRVPPEGRRRPPSARPGRMRETRTKPPWAGKGGDGGSGPRGSRTPGSPSRTPAGPPEERVGGRGKPRRAAGAGRDRFRAALLPSGTRGGTRPPAGRAGYRTGPAALYPGGRRGLGRFGSLEPGRPSRGGRTAERPDARGLGGGEQADPGPPGRTPPPERENLQSPPLAPATKTYLERGTKRARLLAVDHSARASMKNAASCEN